jgi:hypothetical protein
MTRPMPAEGPGSSDVIPATAGVAMPAERLRSSDLACSSTWSDASGGASFFRPHPPPATVAVTGPAMPAEGLCSSDRGTRTAWPTPAEGLRTSDRISSSIMPAEGPRSSDVLRLLSGSSSHARGGASASDSRSSFAFAHASGEAWCLRHEVRLQRPRRGLVPPTATITCDARGEGFVSPTCGVFALTRPCAELRRAGRSAAGRGRPAGPGTPSGSAGAPCGTPR